MVFFPDQNDIKQRARMTQIQFAALGIRLDKKVIISELNSLGYLKRLHTASTYDRSQLSSLLINGWNTEFLLRANFENLKNDALQNSLHWAFPQAYYSVFSVCLAYFHAAGHTEKTHFRVIKRAGLLMEKGWYPPAISFLARGGRTREYINISKHWIPNSLFFDAADPRVVDTQICQFLNATRMSDLHERKKDIKIHKSSGKRKSNFSTADWEQVSTSLGPTSVLNLLYRKRIQANYKDIEPLLSDYLDPQIVYDSIINIVSAMNLVHEAFILKAIGKADYQSVMDSTAKSTKSFVTERFTILTD